MSDSTPATEKFRRSRRRLKTSIMALAGATVGCMSIQHFLLDADRYRPQAIEAIESMTGLPAAIGRLELAFLPRPHVTVYGIVVGEGDFKARVERVTVHAKLMPLVKGDVKVTSVEVVGLSLTVPVEGKELVDKVSTVVSNLTRPDEDAEPLSFDISIDRVFTEDAEVYLGDDAKPVAVFGGDVRGVFSDSMTVALDSVLPQYGAEAEFGGDLTVKRGGSEDAITSITGSGRLAGIRVAKLPVEGAPEAELHANFEVEGTDADYVGVTVEGGLESESVAALAGAFSASVWWDHGVLTVNGFEWDAPGFEIGADVTRHADGQIACSVPKVRVSDDALHALVAMAAFGQFRLESQPGADIEGKNLLAGLSAEGTPRFVRGELSFRGIDLALRSGEMVSAGIHGRIEVEEGLIHVRELAGDGFTLTGDLHPDLDAGTVKLDLRGSAELGLARLAAIMPRDDITDLSGTVSFERIAGTFVQGQGVPSDLVIEGTLEDGKVGISTSGYAGVLEQVRAVFATDSEGIDTQASALSNEFGNLAVAGRYAFAKHEWSGTISANVAKAAAPFLATEQQRELAAPLLAEYGESVFLTKVTLPSADVQGLRIEVVREGDPPVEATDTFEPGDGDAGLVLGAVDASTRITLDHMATVLPEGLAVSGEAAVTLHRDPVEERFAVRVDLSLCSLASGQHIEKKAGDPLFVEVAGAAPSTAWTAQRVTVDCLGVRIPLELEGDRVIGRNLDVALAPLAKLLPDGATARGTIRLNVATTPLEGDVVLDGVGFAIDKDLAVDSISGAVAFRDGTVTCRDLTIQGANSDCVVNVGMENEKWHGRIEGQKLDLNALMVLVDAAQAFLASDEEGAEAPLPAEPVEGEFTVALDKVYYQRGHISGLQAEVVSDEEGVHVRNLSFRTGSGSASGKADLLYAADGTQMLDVDFALDNVDLRILDDMVLAEPQHIRGTLSGSVAFRAPYGTPEDMAKGANGAVSWRATDGSFGKLGMVTKLLSVLKTVQIINLRMPSLRDEGLTFDACYGKLSAVNGVLTFEEAILESTAYDMEAVGVVDFPRDATDAAVYVSVLDSMNSLLEKVPVVGKVAEAATKHARVKINITGSPFDPVFRPAAGQRLIVKPLKAGGKAIKGVLKKALGKDKE